MLQNIIEFKANHQYVDLKEDLPKPIKLNIPEWYKKLQHSATKLTIKGCVPVMDSLTTGYVLSLPQDIMLKNNVLEDNKIISRMIPSVQDTLKTIDLNINVEDVDQTHHRGQVEGSPINKKNLQFPIQKLLNPWTIKTPPGYSCLFVPPLNNEDDRFSIIPAIVNTDTFSLPINFPFIMNGDKYPVLDTTLKRGTPYVQIIPFKRDNWKMKITGTKRTESNKHEVTFLKHSLDIIHRYRTKWWNKSSFF
jgi:hypothetical protein